MFEDPTCRTFPGADELVQRDERLRDRRDAVGAVVLVQVDVIGTEPTERAFDRATDVLGRAARRVCVRTPTELRRDHDSLTTPSERTTEECLAVTVPIGLGGIEERDAGVERRVDNLFRARLVDPPAEVVRPEPDD